MKTPGEDVLVIAAVWLTYASLVLGSNDVKCYFGNLEFKGAYTSHFTIKAPGSCDDYGSVRIENSKIGRFDDESFKVFSKRVDTFHFYSNEGINKANIVFNVNFRHTGVIQYSIYENKNIELGANMRFHENTTFISLRNNGIRDLPSGIFKNLKNMITLILSSNLLTSLDSDTFYGLDKLEQLYLEGNALKNLMPGTFNDLQKLNKLDLRYNQLTMISPDQFKFRNQSNKILPEIYVWRNHLTHLPRCLADVKSFYYTHHSSLNITGRPDSPGTIAENICKNPEKADTTVQFHTTTEAQEETTKEFTTGVMTTSQKIERPGSTNTEIATTASPYQKKPKKYDWAYILFSVLFFLGLPLLGALIWLIWKFVKQRAEVVRLEVEMDSISTQQRESLEMTDLATRNTEASREINQVEPGTSIEPRRSKTHNNLNDPKHPGNKETPKKARRKVATRKSEVKASMANRQKHQHVLKQL